MTPSSQDAQEFLLITKVLIPAPAHALLLRHRLFALLDEGTRRPLILVSASPFDTQPGKYFLVRE